METQKEKLVEEILQSNELAEKRLVNKVYLIIFSMIFVLTTIIIVEFKEYSNNYTEYKIGTNELGPKDLVWAGIMGTPPRYYESNEKHGLGYREFDTREIRKALEDAGINLVYRYMSPNRLEFEFERKHPICFYDRKWSNPEEYFKKKRYPILSLPRFYSGSGHKKIFFRKSERGRFEKHLDSRGYIKLDSLIKDTSLKTELIRKVEYDEPYSNITYGKRQLDGTYYDYVKEKYKKNIDLLILHTNDQIIQMLKWKRFDYQFFDTLEYDDYPWMDGGQNGIDTLTYDSITIKDKNDPNIIYHSVACGNHPLSKIAMPIINEVINTIRMESGNYNRAYSIEKKLNPLTTKPIYSHNIAHNGAFGKSIFQSDDWYFKQFSKLNITPWPMYNDKKKTSPIQIQKNMELLSSLKLPPTKGPHWNKVELTNALGEKSLLIINDVDIKSNLEEEIFQDYFLDTDYMNEKRTVLERKINFSELSFSQDLFFQKIIIFSRGIKDGEFDLLKPLFESPSLKSVTLIESSLSQSKKFLTFIPNQLEQLRLFDVPLMDLYPSNIIGKLSNLKDLTIHSNQDYQNPLWISLDEFTSIIRSLPSSLKTLSFYGNSVTLSLEFSLQAAEVFANKKLSRLKNFTLLNFGISDKATKIILDALPLDLESLIIGNNAASMGISSLLLADFLKAREKMNKIKRLRLYQMILSLNQENKIILPESLEDLLLFQIIGLNDGNFHRIKVSPKMKLKNLSITNCNINDFSLPQLLSQFDLKIKNIDLSNNKITGPVFFMIAKDYASKSKIFEIENLSLGSNPIDDVGIFALSKLPWKIKNLNLSNLKITDNSLSALISNDNWQLSSLNLSNNFLNSKTIEKVLDTFGKNLKKLYLNNLISLDIKMLSNKIYPHLTTLSLSGNMINDEDISILAPKLPENINVLLLSGSKLSAKGAFTIAKHMPKLNYFSLDLNFGEAQEGLLYIFQTLSPYLSYLPKFATPLSLTHSRLLSKNFPPYLYSFDFFEFEEEACNVLFGSLPNSIRSLGLDGNIKSNGQSLKILSENFPSHLLSIKIGNSLPTVERDTFLTKNKNRYLRVGSFEYINSNSVQLVHSLSLYTFMENGPLKAQYFKNIVLPITTIFYGKHENDIPKGLLNSFTKIQLKNLRVFVLLNANNLNGNEIIDFFKKLPIEILVIKIAELKLNSQEIDSLLEILPNGLRTLDIKFNFIGEEGLQKFRAYKMKMEETTGLPFILIEK